MNEGRLMTSLDILVLLINNTAYCVKGESQVMLLIRESVHFHQEKKDNVI